MKHVGTLQWFAHLPSEKDNEYWERHDRERGFRSVMLTEKREGTKGKVVYGLGREVWHAADRKWELARDACGKPINFSESFVKREMKRGSTPDGLPLLAGHIVYDSTNDRIVHGIDWFRFAISEVQLRLSALPPGYKRRSLSIICEANSPIITATWEDVGARLAPLPSADEGDQPHIVEGK
jgi:hypothetical protein